MYYSMVNFLLDRGRLTDYQIADFHFQCPRKNCFYLISTVIYSTRRTDLGFQNRRFYFSNRGRGANFNCFTFLIFLACALLSLVQAVRKTGAFLSHKTNSSKKSSSYTITLCSAHIDGLFISMF